MRVPNPLPIVAACVLSLPALAGGNVHVVAPSAGAGVDFTDLQAAVNAAAAGDLILVQPGSYTVFPLDIQKSITIVADTQAAGSVSILGTVEVKNLVLGDQVGLSDLNITGNGPGIEFFNNDGQIHVESCSIAGSGVPIFIPASGGTVSGCANVTFVDCSLSGSSGPGGDRGLDVFNSTVNFFDSSLSGSKGFTSVQGAAGCQVNGGTIYAMNTSFQGGEGGDGDPGTSPFFFCADGGDGGAGLFLSDSSSATLVDNEFLGGVGGPAPSGSTCSDGGPGPGLDAGAASVTHLPFDARAYTIESPVRVGDTTNLEWEGLPGELCWLVLSAAAEPRFVPLFQGLAVPADPSFLLFIGTVPQSGTLSVPVNIGLNPSKECAVIWEQGLTFRAAVGFVLGTPRQGVILQSGF